MHNSKQKKCGEAVKHWLKINADIKKWYIKRKLKKELLKTKKYIY